MLTKSEFNSSLLKNGYEIPKDDNEIYKHIAAETKNYSREELAMFLAQVIHESGGFQHREEINNHGGYVDDIGLPGKQYHGRGFMQLTWGANYKAASEGLGMGDKLLRYPELVSEDMKLSVLVSTWYWKDRVRPSIVNNMNEFGLTTKAINGAIECSGGWNERAAKRYRIYLNVANAMKIRKKASESGCYPIDDKYAI